jgi:hypothetical protein
MPSEYHIVRVHDMPHTITVSQRSRIAWVAVGEYTGTYIEAVGPRRWRCRETLDRCGVLHRHWESRQVVLIARRWLS